MEGINNTVKAMPGIETKKPLDIYKARKKRISTAASNNEKTETFLKSMEFTIRNICILYKINICIIYERGI